MEVTKIAILAASITVSVTVAQAAEVPDALTVEWQGKHPCEKLFEDAQVRVALYFPARNCARLPLASVIPDVRAKRWSGSGARRKGYAKIDVVAGAFANVPPIPWHEYINVGDTTIQYVVVEKKYEAPAALPPGGDMVILTRASEVLSL